MKSLKPRTTLWVMVLLFVKALILGGCASVPPGDINDACAIFHDKGSWYNSVTQTHKKWGVPPHVTLAIIHQESRFRSDARPPRKKLLWFIPAGRPTSAYGYAQVIDSTWKWYQDKTGNHAARRDDFDDAVDFIGWYVNRSHKTLGLSKWDARNQYLAYHEGHAGYKRKSYNRKRWLLGVADKVANNAVRYRKQLGRCAKTLSSGWQFWHF